MQRKVKRRVGKTLVFNIKLTFIPDNDIPNKERKLRFEIITPSNRVINTPYAYIEDDDKFRFVLEGKDSREIGDYYLTVWENYGDSNQIVADYGVIVTRVQHTWEEEG